MILVLGSCRVCIPLLESKFDCLNTFSRLTGKQYYRIGDVWSINDHYETLQLILGRKDTNKYVGIRYQKYKDISENILFIRKNFDKIKMVIMECSSIKYFTDLEGNLIHNLIHSKINDKCKHKYLKKELSVNEINLYINNIIKILPNKKICFVNHFLHSKIPNRLLMNNCYENFLKTYKKNNLFILTPSDNWTDDNASDWLSDPNHYHDYVLNKIYIWFDLNISKIYTVL